MKIRKRIAVLSAAVVLPASGLVAFSVVQTAGAAGPPFLTCPQLQPDPNPSVPGAGGVTFDNGSGPGSAGLYLSANAGGAGQLAGNAIEGATSLALSTLAIAGETMTITGANGTYTVTQESNTLGEPISQGYPATVAITPSLDVTNKPARGIPLLRRRTPSTVNPTVTTANRSFSDGFINDGTHSLSETDLYSATANFTVADVGQPVSASISGASVFPSGSSVTVAAYVSPTDVTLSSAATSSGGGVVVTIGNDQHAPANLTGDFDFQVSQCQAIPYALFEGIYTPTSATLVGQNAGIANSAIALEANPSNLSLTATYPSLGAGWCDNGGAPGCAIQPTTAITFALARGDKFVLLENSYTYAHGSAVGDYHTTRAALGLAANGMVTCSVGQLQAIDTGTGPDAGSIPQNGNPLEYCDGGYSSSVTPAAALTNLITLELNPQATVYGSDGTSLSAIWAVDAGPQGNAVI